MKIVLLSCVNHQVTGKNTSSVALQMLSQGPVGLRGHHAATYNMRSHPLTNYDLLKSWKQMPYLKHMESESPAGLANVSAIWEQWSSLKCDAATICDLCVSSAHKSLLCNGPHLWWHYTESECGLAGVCRSGHRYLHEHHHTSPVFTVWPAVRLVSVATGYVLQ